MLKRGLALAAALAATLTPFAQAHDDTGDYSTTDHTIVGDGSAGFQHLRGDGSGWGRVVREDLAPAQAGREDRRSSITYIGQLTDFQVSDEESPARVEFLDVTSSPFTAAWRPHEALVPILVDQAIRAMNDHHESPHAQAGGARAEMDLSLITGDQADSMQRNEVEWVIRLLEGGLVNPNSGVEDGLPVCGPNGEAVRYTGVQDYDDWNALGDDTFYDPDDPRGKWAAWPRYEGLMDRAQRPFEAAGSRVPTYVTNGNHDSLAQGNAWATAAYEAIGTGCSKIFAPQPLNSMQAGDVPAPGSPSVASVPADPNRQYVNKEQSRALHFTGAQADGHGYAHVDEDELDASNGAASYYSFEAKPGLRLVSIDTVSEGGVPGPSANGNIDDPQFQWLQRELADAQADGDLVILYGHHPIRSLSSQVPDEAAPPCTPLTDAHGHDPNPGCDLDPRSSQPLRMGADLRDLLLAHRNVIAYVSGHTHEHRIDAFERPDGSGGFWEIETSSIVDWPIQTRVIEVMDNEDGTLSIFGTILDHAGPITAEPSQTPAQGLSETQLAAIGRTLSYNDPQAGHTTGVGRPEDRNVELLLPDPR
jgi:metallophosphoesterase (TIGR03767 family)